MPIYEYRCQNGHDFEVFQSMSDDPVSACEECGAPVERVFHPVAVHFKGSGFYNTDYKNKGRPGDAAKDADSGSKAGSGADSGDSSSGSGGTSSESGSGSDSGSGGTSSESGSDSGGSSSDSGSSSGSGEKKSDSPAKTAGSD
ncbi:MAG TPA: FmdB family zinc ribbon protein [Solirubrobacterales bacterium]|jgi:putative FmdB family regulatory protein|nr:FmdB family zinc ribbon protein [Solirubrobacterales bacterium]